MDVRPRVDIVLPCYNPTGDWIEKIAENLERITNSFKCDFFVYVVNDGSSRGYDEVSLAKLKQLVPSSEAVIYYPNMGKGFALREGISRCNSQFIIYTDCDFPYTLNSFGNVLDALLSGADVVVATRDCSYVKRLPPFRKILSIGSHLVNIVLLNHRIKDTQGGLKGMNEKGKNVFLSTKINGFLFDSEFILKASKIKGLKIKKVHSKIREDIHLSNMGSKILKQELINLFKILFR